MNTEKYTQKSLEALSSAQSIAMQNSNQQVEQLQIFYALLSQNGGLIPSLVTSIGADLNSLLSKL